MESIKIAPELSHFSRLFPTENTILTVQGIRKFSGNLSEDVTSLNQQNFPQQFITHFINELQQEMTLDQTQKILDLLKVKLNQKKKEQKKRKGKKGKKKVQPQQKKVKQTVGQRSLELGEEFLGVNAQLKEEESDKEEEKENESDDESSDDFM